MRTLWKKRWVRWTAEAFLFLVVFAAVSLYQKRDLVQGQAPVITGTLLDGSAFSLAQWRGQTAVVHFWATWCPICRFEQSQIAALAEEWPLVAVAMQSGSEAELKAYLRKEGVALPVLNDPDGEWARAFGVKAVPATFIIGPDGSIRFAEVGYTTGWGLQARLWMTD